MASRTELFPELWLPMTTMLGNLSASLWSMLKSILRISINFFVKCIRPFLLASMSRELESSGFALESDGDDIVAARSAAMAASSVGGRFLAPPSSRPSCFSSLLPSLAANRSFRNCGVSRAGSLISDTREETDLRPSEADSRRSDAVSWAEDTHALVDFLNSGKTI